MDQDKIALATRMILEAIGEDPDREGLRETPNRVARMYAEVFGGLEENSSEVMNTVFDEDYDEVVIVKDIPFTSMCEHHLLPFTGVAHTAYIPSGKVVGISKLARAVDHFARRPQVQERMTNQIADLIVDSLDPIGVAVIVEGVHSCMSIRGVQKPGSKTVTSAMRGAIRKSSKTRNEVLQLIRNSNLPS